MGRGGLPVLSSLPPCPAEAGGIGQAGGGGHKRKEWSGACPPLPTLRPGVPYSPSGTIASVVMRSATSSLTLGT